MKTKINKHTFEAKNKTKPESKQRAILQVDLDISLYQNFVMIEN